MKRPVYKIKLVYCLFRLLLGHPRPSEKTHPRAFYISMRCEIPQCIEIEIALGSVFSEGLKMT